MNNTIMNNKESSIKQYTDDSPTSTNIQDLQVMNQRKQKKTSDGNC